MSRLGKKGIDIPEKTEVSFKDGVLTVKGPKGELSRIFNDKIEIKVEDGHVSLKPKGEDGQTQSLWGTYASHINNMIKGVNEFFEKKLIVEGVGFRVEMKGKELVFHLGFSHPKSIDIPEGIEVSVEKNNISISGSNKEVVGQFAANIKALRKPEPYKGKGIRYKDEVIRRKQGKKAV